MSTDSPGLSRGLGQFGKSITDWLELKASNGKLQISSNNLQKEANLRFANTGEKKTTKSSTKK